MTNELNLNNSISKYYKSFSGTDTLAFILMPGSTPVVLGSLTTISYSMYRNKKPVINIGRTNINGVTRGSRIFAGTMIFTLINQHWLKELQEQIDWIKNFNELKVDELPLFDIMIISANEYGNAVSMYIYGIDFTDEAQTISVEDLFTENTFSFIARDVSNFKKLSTKHGTVYRNSINNKYDTFSQKFFVLDSSPISIDDLDNLEREFANAKLEQLQNTFKKYSLSRNLYYSSSRTMTGNDVAEIQELLNQTGLFDIPVTGTFDGITDEAVKKYQSIVKDDDIDGVVDDKLYNFLINQVNEINDDGTRIGTVINKYGAYVYKDASFDSDIVDTRQYQEQVQIHKVITNNDDNEFQKWYQTDTGYIAEENIYSSYYTGGIIEFPVIDYEDSNSYVTLIQSALSNIYPDFTDITGVYDYNTQNQIKSLQSDNGMEPTGIVDYNTWLLLQSLSGDIIKQVSSDNFKIETSMLPGVYNIEKNKVSENISLFNIKVSCDNYINIKISAICIYDDNVSETLTKTFTVKEEQVISLQELQNAFVYNPKYGKEPRQIDYIVYPYNKKPYKWTIMYS